VREILLAARDRSCGRRLAGSARDSVGSASDPLPPRRVRPLGVGSRLLGGPPARSGHGETPSPLESFAPRVLPASAVHAPARTSGCSRRSGRRRRRNPSAGFRNRMSAPVLDVSARRSIRWLRSPIRPIPGFRVPHEGGKGLPPRRSMCHLRAMTPTAGTGPSSRNRSYHRSAAVPRLRHWPLIRPAASCARAATGDRPLDAAAGRVSEGVGRARRSESILDRYFKP